MTINTPTLEDIPVTKLTADPLVQRALDQSRVNKNVEEFERAAVGVPKVSAREDGVMHLIDGQHRVALMIAAGHGDGSVMCEVYRGLTREEEARLFRLANNTKQVSPIDRFKVRVQEGERNAVVLNTILLRHGWEVNSFPAKGHFAAVRAFEGVLNGKLRGVGSTSSVCDTLIRVITDAWGDSPDGVRGEIVAGLGGVLLRYNTLLDLDKLVALLAKYPAGPRGLVGSAKGIRQFRGGRLQDAMAELLVDLINKNRRGTNKLPDWRSSATMHIDGSSD